MVDIDIRSSPFGRPRIRAYWHVAGMAPETKIIVQRVSPLFVALFFLFFYFLPVYPVGFPIPSGATREGRLHKSAPPGQRRQATSPEGSDHISLAVLCQRFFDRHDPMDASAVLLYLYLQGRSLSSCREHRPNPGFEYELGLLGYREVYA